MILYVLSYFCIGLASWVALALIEFITDTEANFKTLKELVPMILVFIVFWPWAVPFYMYRRWY